MHSWSQPGVVMNAFNSALQRQRPADLEAGVVYKAKDWEEFWPSKEEALDLTTSGTV